MQFISIYNNFSGDMSAVKYVERVLTRSVYKNVKIKKNKEETNIFLLTQIVHFFFKVGS